MACVLFVDDDIATLQIMAAAVEVLGHRALLSAAPKDAVRLAIRNKPDLILIDQRLHDRDGCHIIQDMRKKGALHAIPIYLVSAFVTTELEDCASRAGATGCIQKPVGLETLEKMISTL